MAGRAHTRIPVQITRLDDVEVYTDDTHVEGEKTQVDVDTGVDAGGGYVDIHVDTEVQVDMQL